MSTATSFICPGCERVLRTMSPVACGQKIKCPACSTIFTAPSAEPRPASPIRRLESYAPAPHRRLASEEPAREEQDTWPAPSRRRVDDDDYGDDERPRRRRRRTRSSVPLILGGIATLVVILGVVVGGFVWPGFFLRGGGGDGQLPRPTSEAIASLLGFMPADPLAIGGVDLSRLEKKNKLDDLLARLPQQLGALAPVLPPGLDPLVKDVEAVVAAQEHLHLGVVAVKVKSPIKKETLVRDLKAVERVVQGKKIYRLAAPQGDICALLDGTGKVLVFSRTSEVDFVRMLNNAKGPAGELRTMVDKISGAPVWGIVQVKGVIKQGFDMGFNQGVQLGGGLRNAKDRRAFDMVRQTKAVLGWLDAVDGVRLHCGFVVANAGDAAWLRDETNLSWKRDGQQQFRNVMQMQVGFRAPGQADLLNAVLDDVTNSLRAQSSGNLFWISATFSDNTTQRLVQLADGQALAGLGNFGAPPPPKAKQVLRVQGVVQVNDAPDPVRGVPHKLHICPLTAGRTYHINLTSDWDNYLRLEDAGAAPLAENDDGGGFPNARIVFTAQRTENYRIIVTSFAGETGAYTLTVHEE